MSEHPSFLGVPFLIPVDSLSDHDLYALSSPRYRQKAKTRRALHVEMGRRYCGMSAAPEMAAVPDQRTADQRTADQRTADQRTSPAPPEAA